MIDNTALYQFLSGDFLKKIGAFVKRDFQANSSYKLSFATSFVNIALTVTMYFFMSKLFNKQFSSLLSSYGGDYFAYVIIGIAFYDYINIAQGGVPGSITGSQASGTFEALLVTNTSLPTIVFSSNLYSFLWTSIRVGSFLLVGALGFDLNLGNANYSGALIILALTMMVFSCFGLITASFITVLKRGDPFTWVYNTLSWLLGGLYFPVTVLPGWLHPIAKLLPITYALDGMRLALLKGYPTYKLIGHINALIIFFAVFLPIGTIGFRYALKRAKQDGTLIQY
ncbi:MAG: ABC transporter permease [bacterium]